MPAPQRLPAGEEALACRVPDSRATAVHRKTLVTEKATSRERRRSDEWYHQPLQKAAKARRQRRLQRRRTAPAGEMSQPGRRTLHLFRRPSLDSASCNLKECQSVAEVQSSLKGPTLWVCSWSILDRLEGPIVNKLIRVGGQMLLPSAVTDRTGQDRTFYSGYLSPQTFPTESHRNGFLSIVALFIAAPIPFLPSGQRPNNLNSRNRSIPRHSHRP